MISAEVEIRWLRAASVYGGHFLSAFILAWRRADEVNQEILRSALHAFIEKYPDYLTQAYQERLSR